MEDQLYREAILERYSNPINQGSLDKPDLEATFYNQLCGDEVKLQIKLNKGKIKQARFSGNGCALSQVSASLVAEFIEGKEISEAMNFDSNELINLLGVRPTPARLKCVLLPLEALHEAFKTS